MGSLSRAGHLCRHNPSPLLTEAAAVAVPQHRFFQALPGIGSGPLRACTVSGDTEAGANALSVVVGSTACRAETVDVKYRGPVYLAPFACTDTPRSSFIRRVCYDKPKSYMLIKLQNTWYHCSIPEGTVNSPLSADSAGRYYNGSIKGQYDCRINPVPQY